MSNIKNKLSPGQDVMIFDMPIIYKDFTLDVSVEVKYWLADDPRDFNDVEILQVVDGSGSDIYSKLPADLVEEIVQEASEEVYTLAYMEKLV